MWCGHPVWYVGGVILQQVKSTRLKFFIRMYSERGRSEYMLGVGNLLTTLLGNSFLECIHSFAESTDGCQVYLHQV